MELHFGILLMLLATAIYSQHVPLPGDDQCLFKLKAMNNFTAPLFDGVWYLDSSTTTYGPSVTCVHTLFNYWSKTDHRLQHSDHFNTSTTFWTDKKNLVNGRIKTLDQNHRAKFHGKSGVGEINFWFIDTDYKTYALAYICHHHASSHANEAIALTRNAQGLSTAVRARLQAILDRAAFNARLAKIDTGKCQPH